MNTPEKIPIEHSQMISQLPCAKKFHVNTLHSFHCRLLLWYAGLDVDKKQKVKNSYHTASFI